MTAKAGDIIFIEQEPTMGIIMTRNSTFKLEDYMRKYHVKTLKVGAIMKTDK